MIMGTEHVHNLIIGRGVAGKIIAWTLAEPGPEDRRRRTRDGRRLLPERRLPAQQERQWFP
jgi:hypothetical protein